MTEHLWLNVCWQAYNLLYNDKDYAAECDLIESSFRRYAATPVSSVLDLGCGTGNHAFPMADAAMRWSASTGRRACWRWRSKLASRNDNGGTVRFRARRHPECRTWTRQFDAALMMFAVLGYQVENRDVLAALKTARRHLEPGGLFIFDVWYGPAVLHQRPSERVKIIPRERRRRSCAPLPENWIRPAIRVPCDTTSGN